MKLKAFDVTLNRKRIDTVFQKVEPKATLKETAADVRRSLVNHDGYDPGIKVRARRMEPVK